MSVLLFASSNRSYTALQNVYLELTKRGIPAFFLFSNSTNVSYPTVEIDKFQYDTNVDADLISGYLLESISIHIPFEPKVVILARERWQPEQNIIHETKQKFGSKVYVVEVSSHIINNIENRLEMISRETKYPQNMVDGYFEHSQYAKERRIDCLSKNWGGKSIVVGNPRFDKLYDIDDAKCIAKYEMDTSKKNILFWGVINTTRNNSFDFLRKLQDITDDTYRIFYKPNPQEPTNPIFENQFHPFIIDGVTVIYDDADTNTMSNLCDIHISTISSVCQYSFYFKKKLCILNDVLKVEELTNDYKRYIDEMKHGVEDSAKFWMRVFGVNSYKEFEEIIDISRLETFNKTNKEVLEISRNSVLMCDDSMSFLNSEPKLEDTFIRLFDEYNDGSASKRIVDYLITKDLDEK